MIGNVVLHIGFHKTGTTWLQKEFFPKIENVNFQYFNRFYVPVYKNKLNILSAEQLTGSPFLGDLKLSDKLYQDNLDTLRKTLEQLFKLYPTATILITTRDYKAWVKSCYSEYIKYGGTKDLTEFNILVSHWYYYQKCIIQMAEEIWKKEPIIIKFENLFNYQWHKQTILGLCNYLGCKVPSYDINKRHNVSMTPLQLRLLRFTNRSMPKLRPLIKWVIKIWNK